MRIYGIKYEIIMSEKPFDTFLIPNTFDIHKFCAIIAVGGDGTFHEVVNGMMQRKDKKKIPVGFIGNGSGNDTLK